MNLDEITSPMNLDQMTLSPETIRELDDAAITTTLEAVLGFKIIPYTGPVETGWKDGKPQPPRHAVAEPLIQHRNGKSRMASETEVMLWELLRRTEVR